MEDNIFKRVSNYIKPIPHEGVLEDDEVETLIMSLAKTRGSLAFTEDEVLKIVRWAEGVRINQSLLELTLKGLTYIDWDESTNEPKFTATELGHQVIEGN